MLPLLGLGVIICPPESLKRREDIDVGMEMEMSLPTAHLASEVGIVCCDSDTGKVASFYVFLVPS